MAQEGEDVRVPHAGRFCGPGRRRVPVLELDMKDVGRELCVVDCSYDVVRVVDVKLEFPHFSDRARTRLQLNMEERGWLWWLAFQDEEIENVKCGSRLLLGLPSPAECREIDLLLF